MNSPLAPRIAERAVIQEYLCERVPHLPLVDFESMLIGQQIWGRRVVTIQQTDPEGMNIIFSKEIYEDDQQPVETSWQLLLPDEAILARGVLGPKSRYTSLHLSPFLAGYLNPGDEVEVLRRSDLTPVHRAQVRYVNKERLNQLHRTTVANFMSGLNLPYSLDSLLSFLALCYSTEIDRAAIVTVLALEVE